MILKGSPSDDLINVFIADAALLAEQCKSVTGAAEPLQKAIVRYLAAHFYTLSPHGSGNAQLSQKSLGDASESYVTAVLTSGIGSTSFGQQAIALDPGKCLANLSKPSAFVEVV